MAANVGREHQFGGTWTDRKLKALDAYLRAYTKALKNTPFKKGYIDAFAGTGYRRSRAGGDGELADQLALPDMAAAEPTSLLDGSARIALKVEPRFDRYVFIERHADRVKSLEALRQEFPDRADDIIIHRGDANEVIQKLCRADWRRHRAVLFLDPYGLQVEWTTIEAIASTGAIDLWVLFPLGIGVNRLLTRSGDIPAGWRRRLDRLLGTEDWYQAFYEVQEIPDLFAGTRETTVKARVDTIGEYFVKRLREVFPAVAPSPAVLRNSTHNPLYLLCFAVGSRNRKAQNIALNIANHILKEMA